MVKKSPAKKWKPLIHIHSFEDGTPTCGCVYQDGYILVTPEEQKNREFQKQIKEF